jgi:outer membrane protein OmpA-like peptidoglycan-associated protein
MFVRGSATLVALALLAGCSQPLTTREKGTLVGTGLGAATGAIIGAAVGSPGAGAAIGGAVGAAGGALVGDQLQKRDMELEESQKNIDQQQQEIARNRQLIEELKKQNLEARETERGVVVNLPDVLFEFGKADLTGDARAKIRTISSVLNDQAQGRRVSVEGHTDSIGSEATNQRLSERRAESVVTALENTGVSPQRITAKGFGERYPVAPNSNSDGTDNPAGRSKNRRVEVIIENQENGDLESTVL